MKVLGIAESHASSARLMMDGAVVRMIREDGFTKRKDQAAFPLGAQRSLLGDHLAGDAQALNALYWNLIEAFRRLTGILALLNTSLNLHGEPMNYTVADAVGTLASFELSYPVLPGLQLLCKREAEAAALDILGRRPR
jgi:predicted NodU family carbamoyl transferase